MTYPNLTDEEIQKLRDAIDNTLGNMKSNIRKEKLKVFGKTLLSLAIVAGGVVLAIVFPSPIVIAALGGAAMLIAGNNGVLGQVKDIKKKSKERKKNKEEVKNINTEQSNRKWAERLRSIISHQQEIKNNSGAYKDYAKRFAPEPSAPQT